jgi:hypothetical protein
MNKHSITRLAIALCLAALAFGGQESFAGETPGTKPNGSVERKPARVLKAQAPTRMIRDMTADWAVLQSGYWRLEVDLARPRIVSLRADPSGLARYCSEMLEPGEGGEAEAETEGGFVRSRDSAGHHSEKAPDGGLVLRNIALSDFARVNWHLALAGEKGEILRVQVEREILRPVKLVTETPFALKCLREFAFWSRPSLRFGHDPAGPFRTSYASAAVLILVPAGSLMRQGGGVDGTFG